MAIALEVGWYGTNAGSEAPRHLADRKRCWSEDSEKMLQLMTGQFKRCDEASDLLDVPSATAHMMLELESERPLPYGWEKCLDLKTGTVYYVNSRSGKKILRDPRQLSRWHEITPSVEKATKLSSVENIFRGDSVKMQSPISCASLLSVPLMEQASEKRFPRIDKSTIEDSLLKTSEEPLEKQEAQLIDAFEDKDENTPALGDESFVDGSLELKLTLEPTSILPKERESALNFPTGSVKDDGLKSPSQEIAASDLTTANLLQLRSYAADPRTTVRAASSSSSSAHMSWSWQTQADSCSDSRECGRSRSSSSSQPGESKNGEREGDQSLAIVGCSNCLMYVMLYKMDPRCPKCGSSVLLDFPNNSVSTSKKPRLA